MSRQWAAGNFPGRTRKGALRAEAAGLTLANVVRPSPLSDFFIPPMFEQAFKNIDDVLWKDAGCTSELDYTE